MTDCVRLYVFDCQNFVSEKDYRAVLEQRRGFENAALDNETAAKNAKLELELAYDEMRNLYIDIDKAHEAGRREGLESNERLIQDMAMLLRRMAHKHPDSLSASAAKFLHKHGLWGSVIREIDSPKAEGEETK